MANRRIRVRLQPRASKNELKGWKEDPATGEKVLQARVTAPPVDGKANKEIISFLSKTLNIAQKNIEILKGDKNKNKIVFIADENLNSLSLKLCSSSD